MTVSDLCEEFKNFKKSDIIVVKPCSYCKTSEGARLKGFFELCSAPPCKGEGEKMTFASAAKALECIPCASEVVGVLSDGACCCAGKPLHVVRIFSNGEETTVLLK